MDNYYNLFKNCKLNEKYKIIIIDKMFYLKMPINYDFQMLQIRKITLFNRKLLNNKDLTSRSYLYRPNNREKLTSRVRIDKYRLFNISKINIVFNLNGGGISTTKIRTNQCKRKRIFFSSIFSTYKADKDKFFYQLKPSLSMLIYKNLLELSPNTTTSSLNEIKTKNIKIDFKLEQEINFLPVIQQNKK